MTPTQIRKHTGRPVRRKRVWRVRGKDVAIVGILAFLLISTCILDSYWLRFRGLLTGRTDFLARVWAAYGAIDPEFSTHPSRFVIAYQSIHLFVLAPLYAWLILAIVTGRRYRDWLQLAVSSLLCYSSLIYLVASGFSLRIVGVWAPLLAASVFIAWDSLTIIWLRTRTPEVHQSRVLKTMSEVSQIRPQHLRAASLAAASVAVSLGGIHRVRRTPKSPPEIPGSVPLLGHALEFIRDPVSLIQRGYQHCGEVFSFRLANRPVSALIGPKANEAFCRATDQQLSIQEVYRFLLPVFGEGVLLNAAPDVLEEQVSYFLPSLHTNQMAVWVRLIAEQVEARLEQLPDRGELELGAFTDEMQGLVASRFILGPEFVGPIQEEYTRIYFDVAKAINGVSFLWPYAPLPSHRRRDRARLAFDRLISGVIAQRTARGVEGDDLLQVLMKTQTGDGKPLTDKLITSLLTALLVVARDSTAGTTAWTGILLLQNQRYLQRVLEEQKQVFGGNEETSLEAIRRLVVLERCVKEAERMRPVAALIMRTILQDFEYGGFVMPAGGLMMISPAVSHRLPHVFAHPDVYDPDRFGPGREEDRKTPYSLIGFGGGRHRCIGYALAYTTVKVVWSILLRRLDFHFLPYKPEPNYNEFTVGPKKPIPVRYERKRPVRVGAEPGRDSPLPTEL